MAKAHPVELFPVDTKVTEDEDFTFGNHRYIRHKSIAIDEVLGQLRETGQNVYYLHLYCDSLTHKRPAEQRCVTLHLPGSIRTIFIFARDFLTQVPELSELELSASERGCQIIFFYETAPPNLVIRGLQSRRRLAVFHDSAECPETALNEDGTVGEASHVHVFESRSVVKLDQTKTDQALQNGGGGRHEIHVPISSAADCGRLVRITHEGDVQVKSLEHVSPHELDGPSVADVQELGPDLRRTDNLSKLLHGLFVTVSTGIFSQQDASTNISRLKFILNCTRGSTSQVSLTTDAQKLFDRLELAARSSTTETTPLGANFKSAVSNKVTGPKQYYVPNQEPKIYLADLESRIKQAKNIEGTIKGIDMKTEDEGALRGMFSTVLGEMGKNIRGFIDIKQNERKAFEAMEDCEKRRKEMNDYVQATRVAQEAFNGGVREYLAGKEAEFQWEMIKLGGELVIGVVVAVATCGASAPLTAATFAKGVEAAAKGMTLWEKIKSALKKIADVMAKLIPKVLAANSSQAAYTQRGRQASDQNALATAANKISASSLPPDARTTVDFYGILADWDEFDLKVDEMFADLHDELKGEDKIKGMPQYKTALKSQAIRGRAVLYSMRDVQEATQFHYRQLADSKARDARYQELQAVAAKVTEESGMRTAERALRHSLAAEQTGIRRSLFVRLHLYLLSLVYDTNDDNDMDTLLASHQVTAASSAAQVHELVDAIRTEIVAKARQVQDIGKKDNSITLTTQNRKVFPENWKELLLADKKLYFSVPWTLSATGQYGRVRVHAMTARFEGLAPPRDWHVEWEWELGPAAVDKNALRQPVRYYMPPRTLVQSRDAGTGWGEGQLRDEDNQFNEPALFCQGRIALLPVQRRGDDGEEEESLPADVLNLKDVSGVTLHFTCSGWNLGQKLG